MSESNLWSGRKWVGPIRLEDTGDLPREPGLYRLVAFRESGMVGIPRFLGTDEFGVLYVGKADRLRGRVLTLARCILEGKRGHAAGVSFERIDFLRESGGLPPISDEFDLRVFYSRCTSPSAAQAAERKILHTYLAEFGEVPPLNSQVSWREIC